MKKIGIWILLLLCCILPVRAQEMGSIKIELQDSIDDLSKENVEFEIVQVAKLVDGYYVWDEAFQDVSLDLNAELKAEEMEQLIGDLKNKEYEGIRVKTDEKGIVKISDVDQGLYLIDPVNINEYENVQSMLVSVPEWDEEDLVYHVVVYPKHSPFEKLVLKKVDRDTQKEILDSIEFTSYKDKDCKEEIKTYKGNGTITFLLRDQKMYLKETKAPSGYILSKQVICVEVKDHDLYVDGKKLETNEFLFENTKVDVPTGVQYQENIYVTLGLISLVVILHLIYKKLRK
ncbi:SpaA isopeptide-forming pilin-related protein [uncultured Holdemanella sp.]|uniref:SpaA isopeptide-forming pilin-related protein n=1 Tax=uncultured Holdemanella sp. TaxID=1763549 RepID=UPI0025D55FB1|nr:SpaA isopeptide-forming pilin-related protein [uncultured Holdemanella sp.]